MKLLENISYNKSIGDLKKSRAECVRIEMEIIENLNLIQLLTCTMCIGVETIENSIKSVVNRLRYRELFR